MPNINLIAQKREEKARLERTVRRLFFLMSGLFIAAIILFTLLSAQWFRIKADVNEMNEELVKLQPRVDKIKFLESRIRELKPRIQLYTTARQHTLKWYNYLHIVAHCLPQQAWLTRMSTQQVATSASAGSGPPPAAKVNISGVTVNQQLVGETMLRLNSYGSAIESVELNYTRPATQGATPVIEFEVATGLKDVPAFFDGRPPKPVSTAQGEADETQKKT
jgi:Tfp pilus assembly protein PilN